MQLFGPTCDCKPRYRSVIITLDVLLMVATAAALAMLVLRFGGFGLSLGQQRGLRLLQAALVVIFVADRVVRLLTARRLGKFFRENLVDFALIGLMFAALATGYFLRDKLPRGPLSLGAAYVVITQVFIVLLLVGRAVNFNMRLAGSGITPVWLLVISFALLAAVGSGVLMLPAATPDNSPLSYMDSLFTSVSATCVTGLIVRDTGAEFTTFGQAVILILIQCGGLGIMLFGTAVAIAVGKGLSFRSSSAVGEMLSIDTVGEVQRTMRFVVMTTFALEAIGAASMYPMFAAGAGSAGEAVWRSVFHSVSAFCNAGFSLYARNMMHGVGDAQVGALRDHWQMMGVMAPLIVLGGLGFPVLRDCTRSARRVLRRVRASLRPTLGAAVHLKAGPTVTLHSKLVLATTGFLLVAGTIGMLLTGPASLPAPNGSPAAMAQPAGPNDWQSLSMGKRIGAAMFQSVTARTAGFNTIDMAELSPAGKLGLCGLMVIGGSPASTAGGMKTVTVALLVLTTLAALRRRREVEAFRRSMSLELLRKAVAIGVLFLALVALVTLALTIMMGSRFAFIDLLFEAASACGTVGLSTGVTQHLTGGAKCVIVGAMFAGRLGPLTLLLAMTSHLRPARYTYPTENVLIG